MFCFVSNQPPQNESEMPFSCAICPHSFSTVSGFHTNNLTITIIPVYNDIFCYISELRVRLFFWEPSEL